MTPDQWESLCDGCAKCCLEKLEDEDTGAVLYTAVACAFLDIEQCRCARYDERFAIASNCLSLTPATVGQYHWLPDTCAYRRIAEGRDLESWHPLISGDRESVHTAGISIRHKVLSAGFVHSEDLDAYVIETGDDF